MNKKKVMKNLCFMMLHKKITNEYFHILYYVDRKYETKLY